MPPSRRGIIHQFWISRRPRLRLPRRLRSLLSGPRLRQRRRARSRCRSRAPSESLPRPPQRHQRQWHCQRRRHALHHHLAAPGLLPSPPAPSPPTRPRSAAPRATRTPRPPPPTSSGAADDCSANPCASRPVTPQPLGFSYGQPDTVTASLNGLHLKPPTTSALSPKTPPPLPCRGQTVPSPPPAPRSVPNGLSHRRHPRRTGRHIPPPTPRLRTRSCPVI